MQNSFQTITPRKKTLARQPMLDDNFMKELSPLFMTGHSSNYGKAKLEMMLSPLPANKDLFSQLLASGLKPNQEDDFQRYEILEEESFEQMDELMINHSQSEGSL